LILFVKNQNLGKHVRKKKLEVNVEKMRMMVFNKRQRKNKENQWNGEGRKIEQVNEFKYLSHTFNERATDKCLGNRREKVGR
jgi:hypothetical protein